MAFAAVRLRLSGGALAYLAAYGIGQGRVFGRCETTTGIAPFTALVDQVMSQEPYASAKRVFWIVDNGSSHRGLAAIDRLAAQYPNAMMVHTPVHASWLNQVEIYFSIIQRKVLSPNDFTNLTAVEQRLLAFEYRYNATALSFNGNTPQPIATGTSNDSNSTNGPPKPHDPRRTNEPDHLGAAPLDEVTDSAGRNSRLCQESHRWADCDQISEILFRDRRYDDHRWPCGSPDGSELLGKIKPALVAEVDVHEDDVRPQLLCQSQRVGGAGC